MSTDIVLFLIALGLFALYRRFFRLLPQEQWQVLAVIPRMAKANSANGINLTWYGLITGTAGAVACALFIVLSQSIDIDPALVVTVLTCLLAVCLPAAKLIATYVEKNPHGFTVGGASFTGFLITPPLLWLINQSRITDHPAPVIALLAAASISYALGEGIGRLACLSFGCCYGKPMKHAPPWMQSLLGFWQHRYHGKLKKITFAGNMEGVTVIPVQAMGSIVLTVLALLSCSLFFHGDFTSALLLSLIGSQVWRIYSETLRADYRGGLTQFSAYQGMAAISCVYVVAVALVLPPETDTHASALTGLAALWHPGTILLLQTIGVGMFLFAGTSTITQSTVTLSLAPNWKAQTDCNPQEVSHTSDAR